MLLSACERMLNEHIQASTPARERLSALDGKRFAVDVRGTGLRIVAIAGRDRITLSLDDDADADVELSAGPIDLLLLARSATLSDLKGRDAEMSGDLHTADAFAELLRLAIPDGESALADWIGDMPAHAVSDVSRDVLGWTKRAALAFEQNAAEFLQEESPTLVPRVLVDRLVDDIDDIRDGVERAERRIGLLEQRLKR